MNANALFAVKLLGLDLSWVELGIVGFIAVAWLGTVGWAIRVWIRTRRGRRCLHEARECVNAGDLDQARKLALEAEGLWSLGDGDRLGHSKDLARYLEILVLLRSVESTSINQVAIEELSTACRDLMAFFDASENFYLDGRGLWPSVTQSYLSKYDRFNFSRASLRERRAQATPAG